VRTKVEQAKLFLSTIQASPDLAEALDRVWGIYKERAGTAKSVWGRARGPAQSLMAGLSAIGWKLHTPTLSPEGQHYKMVKGEPKHLLVMYLINITIDILIIISIYKIKQ
jgi:hypothetical protein